MFNPDLVKTLRICERDQAVDRLMNDAADEIERLREENAKLRRLNPDLTGYANDYADAMEDAPDPMFSDADAAFMVEMGRKEIERLRSFVSDFCGDYLEHEDLPISEAMYEVHKDLLNSFIYPQDSTDETSNRDGKKSASQPVSQTPNSPCPSEVSQSGTSNGAWLPMDTAPPGEVTEDVGCRDCSKWFYGKVAKKYSQFRPPFIVIRRRAWPHEDTWECAGEASYVPDFFDGWQPLSEPQ